jgi:protein phosphatase
MTQANLWLPEAAAHTSAGRVRSRNEDAFGFCIEHGIFVVCDGMGGAAAGEVASRMVVEQVVERMCSGHAGLSAGECLHQAVADANRAVYERAERDASLYGMGTTLVVLHLRHSPADGSFAVIAHAGDSRCYLFRGGRLERRTRDHSLVDEQVRLGTMTSEEAERSPLRSVITRAIGTQPSVTEEVSEVEMESGDLFLLCSDGLTREVSEPQIAAILAGHTDLATLALRLVDQANRAGGHDNITCLLVRVP